LSAPALKDLTNLRKKFIHMELCSINLEVMPFFEQRGRLGSVQTVNMQCQYKVDWSLKNDAMQSMKQKN
jgi:hypothetical protein